MQGRWDPDGLGLRPVGDVGTSQAAKSRYLTMVSVAAAAAVALPTAFVFSPPMAQSAGWVAAELYWPAVICTFLSLVASVLLILAALRNSPPLLIAAGVTAGITLTTGLTALFPTFPLAVVSVLAAACGFIAQILLQLSLGAPLLYAALVGVSAATKSVRARFDRNADRAKSTHDGCHRLAGTGRRRPSGASNRRPSPQKLSQQRAIPTGHKPNQQRE